MVPGKPLNRNTTSRWRMVFLAFAVVFLLPLALHGVWWLGKDHPASWRAADWSSAGLLPPPSEVRRALIFVLAAPAGRWKGVFSVHSWIVVKEKDAPRYTRYDVAGWGKPVKIDNWAPDGRWFGSTPQLIAAVEGEVAERLIPKIKSAVVDYPYNQAGDYRVWPGPNSNTFIAHVLARVPEAGIALPPNAIGKDFRNFGVYLGASPTRTGIQGSLVWPFRADPRLGRSTGGEPIQLGCRNRFPSVRDQVAGLGGDAASAVADDTGRWLEAADRYFTSAKFGANRNAVSTS